MANTTEIGNTLNSCQAVMGNTGTGQCFFDIETVGGVIFAPKGSTLPTTTLNALQVAIKAQLLSDVPRTRLFPVNNIIDCKPNSEKLVIQTSNTGAKKVVRDVYDQLDLMWWDGGFCLLYQLRKGNGLNNPFYLYTINGLLIGVDAGPGLIKPITPTLAWANAMGWSDGTKSAEYGVTLSWNAKLTNDNVKIIDFSTVGGQGYLDSLTGLETIKLTEQSRVAGLVDIGLQLACGGVDLFPTYPTQLVASLWVSYADNGGFANLSKPIAITSSTPIADGYAIQLNTSDANYPTPMAAPGTPTLVTGSGGTLPATGVFVKQTALNQYGETIASTEANATPSASGTIAVTNSAVTGATSYKTYYGTTTNAENNVITSSTPNITISAPTATAGTLPTTNTAGAPVWIGLVGPTELLAAGIGGADGNSGFEAPLVSFRF